MPTSLYLTALKLAKRARLTKSSVITYWTSLGLSGGCEQGWTTFCQAKSKTKKMSTKNQSVEVGNVARTCQLINIFKVIQKIIKKCFVAIIQCVVWT